MMMYDYWPAAVRHRGRLSTQKTKARVHSSEVCPIYRKPINETATSTAQAERDILDLLIVVASELPVDEVAAALAVAILGVDVMLNTFLTILASASTTLVLRLSRSDWTPDGREVTHAGVERPVTGGAVAKEYWSVVGNGKKDSTLLARDESSEAGISKATAIASDVATGPLRSEDSYEASAEDICVLCEASMLVD